VNDVELLYETAGVGDSLVLVHGSWADHASWQQVVPGLARSFRVVTYDRRGHGRSGRPPGQGTRAQDEADLAALLEVLRLAPAHVAGSSFGASIVLGLATARPDLIRSIIVHEPPLSAVVADDSEMQPLLQDFQVKIEAVLRRLEVGDIDDGSRLFVEQVAIGPGAWETLPAQVRRTFIDNAMTWVDEQRDAHWAEIDLGRLSRLACPVLFTRGDRSFPWFPRIINKLQTVIPNAQVHTFMGAGHIPHFTHPDEYVKATSEFARAVGGTPRATG
jgi:pimeloyl-ACP methyl ester carboxylesterase